MKKILLTVITAIIVFSILGVLIKSSVSAQSLGTYQSDLARCLTAKGVKMYGTLSCPSCQKQKDLFGDSVRYINFIDCDRYPALCKSKNIRGYPTWEFPNGEMLSGIIPLSYFAKKTNCETPIQQPTVSTPPKSPISSAESAMFLAAFLAGLASFLAPCLLPLLPTYFTVITGFTFRDLYGLNYSDIRRRVIGSSFLFVAGFSLIYTLLGATGSWIGTFLQGELNILLRLNGFILIFLGLMQIGIINFHFLNFDYAWRVQKRLTNLGLITAFVTGMVAALSWIPCITPTLSPILLLAAGKPTVFAGSLLLFVFSMGLGTPFIITGLFFPQVVRSFQEHRKLLHALSIIAGIILVAFGITLAADYYQQYLSFIRSLINQLPL